MPQDENETTEVPRPSQDVHDNTIYGPQYNALRDNNVTNYLTGARHLRPRPVDPLREMPGKHYVRPDGFDDALRAMRPAHGSGSPVHVVVLLAPEAHGRRSAALQLLASVPKVQGRVFELLPDWEEPDESCLPRERNAGYLLNLRGLVDPLPNTFYSDLSTYAAAARGEGRYLVITAAERVWTRTHTAGSHAGIAVIPIGRPNAIEITKKALDSQEETEGRGAWLHEEGSVFRDLLPDKAPPADAVHLARVIGKATGIKDDTVLDEYRGWQDLLTKWFGGTDAQEPPKRAIRISTAFLDCAPASVVLNCADLLLKHPKIDWPADKGGLLAGPDAATRLEQAHVDFRSTDGTASLEKERPGLGKATLQYLWLRREQLVPVLRQWLQDISAANGPANDHLACLATALTGLAETAGVGTVFDLVEKWLDSNKKEDRQLAADLLSELAAHPSLGAQTRKKLAGWARGKSLPVRQRAVAQACGGSFGRTFTSEALTRLRYVLETPGAPFVQPEAIATLRSLAAEPELSLQVVDTLASWCSTVQTGAATFLALFGLSVADNRSSDLALVKRLLEAEGARGEALRARLTDGWRDLFESDEKETGQALLRWRRAAESGELPTAEVVDLIIALADVRSSPLNHPIKQVITPAGTLHDQLVDRFLERVLQSVDPAPVSTAPDSDEQRERGTAGDDNELPM